MKRLMFELRVCFDSLQKVAKSKILGKPFRGGFISQLSDG